MIFFTGLCQNEEVEFCDAVDVMLSVNSTNPFLPQNCRVFYCTSSGVTFSCQITAGGIAQFSIELCTNPPRQVCINTAPSIGLTTYGIQLGCNTPDGLNNYTQALTTCVMIPYCMCILPAM